MTYESGHVGPGVRGDVRVTLVPADVFSFSVQSTVEVLYGRAMREQVAAAAARWGDPPFKLAAEDSGALPFAWDARLDAAFAKAVGGAPAFRTERKPVRERLRRSRLYAPGDAPKLILNATLPGPDVVVIDLEDAVPPARKSDALWMVAHALRTLDFGRAEVAVRVNHGLQDLAALAHNGVQCFWLPKCDTADDVASASALLDEMGSPSLIVPLVESALGVENAFEVVRASPRVVAVSLGVEDYLSDIGAERTSGQAETAWARARVLNAAVAAGITPLASVFPRFEDPTEVESYARGARAAGYQGVGCIHPAQVDPVHRGYQPALAEIEQARSIVEAYLTSDGSATSAAGRMVDEPVYRRAQRVLQLGGLDEPT